MGIHKAFANFLRSFLRQGLLIANDIALFWANFFPLRRHPLNFNLTTNLRHFSNIHPTFFEGGCQPRSKTSNNGPKWQVIYHIQPFLVVYSWRSGGSTRTNQNKKTRIPSFFVVRLTGSDFGSFFCVVRLTESEL